MVTNIGFAYSHFGSHKKKLNENVERPHLNTSTERGDCKAYMYVKLRQTTLKWEVGQFCDEHNHTFVSPSKKIFLKQNRMMPATAKGMVELFQRENMQINKVTAIFGGDVIGFTNQNVEKVDYIV
ncbi:hypothetical protein IFM89_026616 [Coptis chinensis]|uniref:FAR1 domain-containing protein n=1 Tax=Coptis chinensis TaxID=261450 RepID=A0A835LMU4_9MAGN|nr:hypothetical protein IFM89_026616 [Coptis chinensis]